VKSQENIQGTSGRIEFISISRSRGTAKENVSEAYLKENFGIVGDAHADNWHRQVSLLPLEAIEEFRTGKSIEVHPGDFAENIAVSGIDFKLLTLGVKLRLGDTAILEVTQIGKECHDRCHIFDTVGDCIMPKMGVFTKVLAGGEIKVGDCITFI